MWFGHARLRVEGQTVEVATDSQFVARWIDTHFSGELEDVARETLGSQAEIAVHVAPDVCGRRDEKRNGDSRPDPERPAHAGPGAAEAPRRAADTLPSPAEAQMRNRRTFRRLEDFVVGPSNGLAHSAACRIAQPTDAVGCSPTFIHGGCGLGKTHLLQGICRRYAELTERPSAVRYVTGEQFTNEYITALRNNTIDRFRRKARRLELLAIDDVHFLANKHRTQNEFLHTIDEIGLTGSRIVLASDEHPRHIGRFSQALISRFLSGMVVQSTSSRHWPCSPRPYPRLLSTGQPVQPPRRAGPKSAPPWCSSCSGITTDNLPGRFAWRSWSRSSAGVWAYRKTT